MRNRLNKGRFFRSIEWRVVVGRLCQSVAGRGLMSGSRRNAVPKGGWSEAQLWHSLPTTIQLVLTMAFDSVGDGSLRPYSYRHLKPAGQPAAGVGELLFRNAVRADEPDSDGLLA